MFFDQFLRKSVAFILLISFFKNVNAQQTDSLIYSDEKHFKHIQQLTFNGDNAEAYWSFDDKQIIFQRKNENEGVLCDRMFIGMVPQNGNPFNFQQLSSGKGRTTCGYFLPDGKQVIYASTHLGGDSCPPVPDRSKYNNRYLWPIYDTYDIFLADTSGKIIKQLTKTKGYDAEATLSPDGNKMIFTSVRNGDLDRWPLLTFGGQLMAGRLHVSALASKEKERHAGGNEHDDDTGDVEPGGSAALAIGIRHCIPPLQSVRLWNRQ